MGKKNKAPAVPTSEHAKLTYSPFAALSARQVATAPPAAAGSEPVANAPPTAAAKAGSVPAKPASLGRLVLRRETKHRGGKAVVIVSGFSSLVGFSDAALEELAKACKRTLGCGGTVDAGEIVLQGDRPAEVAELLRGKGFRVAGVTS